MTMHEITLTTGEIRVAWQAMQDGTSPFTKRQDGSGVAGHYRNGHYTGDRVFPFVGVSGSEMNDRLRNGFSVPGSDLDLPTGMAEVQVPTLDLVEEDGDLVISAALAGDDLHRIRWEDLNGHRGITIRAQFGMSAATGADVFADYTRWILQLVDACQAKGIAPGLELICGARNAFRSSKDSMNVTIPLVQPGEIIDPTAWRAFISPGSFRSLGFVALALAADRVKRSLSMGMGFPMGKGWNVTQDGDVIHVDAPPTGGSFPAEHMNTLLAGLDI